MTLTQKADAHQADMMPTACGWRLCASEDGGGKEGVRLSTTDVLRLSSLLSPLTVKEGVCGEEKRKSQACVWFVGQDGFLRC